MESAYLERLTESKRRGIKVRLHLAGAAQPVVR
jgi:hypothetical protein